MNAMHQMSSVFQNKLSPSATDAPLVSSMTISGRKLRLTPPQSPWIDELKMRFNELTALPRGWNGYTSHPVSFDCAQFAATLIERLFIAGIPTPQMVPGDDGTLQLEWHLNQYDVEIDILAPYNVHAVRHNHRNGEVQELELQMDFTPLMEWIEDLKPVQTHGLRVA